ncbi:Cupin domain protein [compost metagenome]
MHARSFNGPQDFARHPGAEFVHVLSGAICVYFENGEQVRLARGDSLYFDSRLGHAYVTVSRQLARIVGVSTNESHLMALARQGAAQE